MIRSTIATIKTDLGTVSAVLWTAFRNGGVTNVLSTRPEDVERVFDIGITGLRTCVQETLEDLKWVRLPQSDSQAAIGSVRLA